MAEPGRQAATLLLDVGPAGFFKSAPVESDESNKRCGNDDQTKGDRAYEDDRMFHTAELWTNVRLAAKTDDSQRVSTNRPTGNLDGGRTMRRPYPCRDRSNRSSHRTGQN
jgi:hypothetical protein